MHTGSDINITFKLGICGLYNLPLFFVVISIAYYENNHFDVFFNLRNDRNIFTGYYVMELSGDQIIGLKPCLLTIFLHVFIIIHYYFSYTLLQKPIIFRLYSLISYQDLAFFSVRLTPDLIHSFLAGEIHPEKTPVAKIQDPHSFSWNRTNKTEITRGLKILSQY